MKKNVLGTEKINEECFYLIVGGKKVAVTEEVYHAVKDPVRAEKKAQQRAWRCRDGKGVRCNNDCNECAYFRAGGDPTGSVVSLDKMREDSDYEHGGSHCVETEAINNKIVEDVYRVLAEMDPMFTELWEMLYNDVTQETMAKKLGKPRSTVRGKIAKLQKVLQKEVGHYFDR